MKNNDNKGLIIVALFAGAILALYLISKILLTLGITIVIISIFVFIFGLLTKDDRYFMIGCIGLFCGLILGVIGGSGIDFFENNSTGKNLLDASNSIVNSTKDVINIYNQ